MRSRRWRVLAYGACVALGWAAAEASAGRWLTEEELNTLKEIKRHQTLDYQINLEEEMEALALETGWELKWTGSEPGTGAPYFYFPHPVSDREMAAVQTGIERAQARARGRVR